MQQTYGYLAEVWAHLACFLCGSRQTNRCYNPIAAGGTHSTVAIIEGRPLSPASEGLFGRGPRTIPHGTHRTVDKLFRDLRSGPDAMPHNTTDQLRLDIDNGKTGYKQPGSDPSAAPLDTDYEAGSPASQSAVSAQQSSETSKKPTEIGSDTGGVGHAWILFGFAVLLGIILVCFMIWHRGGLG